MITSDDLVSFRFRVVRGRAGYVMAEVDDALDMIAAAMRSGAFPVQVSGFNTARFFAESYAVDEVDELLGRLRAQGTVAF